MNGLAPIRGAASAATASATPANPAAPTTTMSLLPSPAADSSDGMSALYVLLSKDRQLGLRHQTADVHHDQVARTKARQRAFADLMNALAEAHKGGFFHDLASASLKVAQVATIAAAVAVAVGSGGTAAWLAYAGVLLSSAAFAQGETHYLQKLGVSDSAAAWTEVGMSVGGSVGTGAAAYGVQNSSAALFGRIASSGAGAATAAGGAATWEAGIHDSCAKHHQADATAAKGEEDHLDRLIRTILADLDHSEKSDQRTLDNLRKAIQGKGEAIVLASRRV